MTQTLRIFRKEFQDYFVSPIAYIVICIFLLVTGWLFFSTFFIYNQANLRTFFGLLPLTFSFVIPAVTMRLFSEEFHSGSCEMLLTLPVRLSDVVAGKFLAGTAFAAAMLVPTLSYAASVACIGEIDWGPVAGGYTGAVLLGGAYSAVGLFASSLTRNQIVAFITGMVVCFSLTVIDKMAIFFPAALAGVLTQISAGHHFENIARGILDTRDVLYFASVIFVFLYSTHMVMQEKR
jgi:ABC-2 type transport system permease protein